MPKSIRSRLSNPGWLLSMRQAWVQAGLALLLLFAAPAVAAVGAPLYHCNTPASMGAIVDVATRCAFFAKFERIDKTPDERIVKNLKLKPGELARSIAVIVGISEYTNKDFNIPAARVDVEKLKDFLINDQKFDEVIVLENKNATIENIRYFLRTYAINRTNYFQGKVRFLFAYSGHGIPIPFSFGDPTQDDARKPSVGLALSAAADQDDYQNIYGLNELRALLNDIAKNSYHLVGLFNACYGGDVFAGGEEGGSPSDFSGRGARAITAGPNDRVVFSTADGKGSLFFNAIIEGIRSGEADLESRKATLGMPGSLPEFKGIVRLGELDGYIGTAMRRAIPSDSPGAEEHGNRHHWIGLLEPYNVRADGGFFFFQYPPDPASDAYQPARQSGGAYAPSANQTEIPPIKRAQDGLERLRSLPAPVRGIDVSRFTGEIDWRAVAGDQIQFAYIKATQSNQGTDRAFLRNWTAAKEAGLLRGAYHYFSFCANVEGQFSNIKRTVPVDHDALPVALDIELFPEQERSTISNLQSEGACAVAAGNGPIRENVQKLIRLIEETYGLPPIVYGNDYALDQVLTPPVLSRVTLWRARYGLGKNPPEPWGLWQYSQNAKVAGVPGPVDLNVVGLPRPRM